MNKAVWREDMPLRRFMILLRGLPPDSGWAYFLDNKENYDAASYEHNLQNIQI